MAKKFYTSPPAGYAVCQHADCPMADTCLHQIVYPAALEKDDVMSVVNPSKCSKDGKCRYYRSNKPVTYARGFAHFKDRMYPEQYARFSMILIGKFGRNAYYERRRGDVTLSPTEQRIVLEALKRAGVTEEMRFDSYVDNINWYD